jgi:hypothetical protein
MSYALSSFGIAYFFALYEQRTPVGTADSISEYVELDDGGAFDGLGTARAERQEYTFALQGELVGDTPAALDTAYRALLANRGKRDNLYRLRADGVTWEWISARLLRVTGTKAPGDMLVQKVTLQFKSGDPAWSRAYHGGWFLDDGHYLDAGLYLDSAEDYLLDAAPKVITLNNAGETPVHAVQIVATAAGSNITNLVIQRKIAGVVQEHLVYSGVLLTGNSLAIDTGVASVKNNAVDDYANFGLGASHISDWWLTLEPGDNTIEVTRTGGNNSSTVKFYFWEASE